MRADKWIPLADLTNPGLRRVLEGMRRLNAELQQCDDDDLRQVLRRENASSRKDSPSLH